MIRIETEIDGKPLTIEALHPSEMTVGDWVRLVSEQGDSESVMMARYLGLSEDQYRAIPLWALSQIEDAYVEAFTALSKEVSASALESTYLWGDTRYTVPQDIDKDTTIGQWADLSRVLADMDSAAQAAPAILAHLLVPVGEKYSGGDMERFKAFPLMDGMRYVAFFLTSSERLTSAIDRIVLRSLTSLQGLIEQGLRTSAGGGQGGTSSSEPQTTTTG